MTPDTPNDPEQRDDVPEIDVRDLIGDPDPKAPPAPMAEVDSPGTPGGTAGTGGENKVQSDQDL